MIVRRSEKNVFSIHFDDRKWISIVEFVSTRDQLFQSLIIFVDKIVQKAWTNVWSKFVYAVSHYDWIDNEIDLIWLIDVFHSQTIHLKDRRLLLLDEHVSHVSVKFIEFCWLMNIVSLCSSSHIIQYLQSLDVDCFDSLDKAYRKQLDKKNKIEIMQINKLDFLAFLKETRVEIMIESIIRFVWIKIDTILWKIFRFTKSSLTNSDIYSFDSTRMLKQLSQHNQRSMISSSLLTSTILNKTSINQSKLKNLLNSLNLYTLNHRIKLSRVKKTLDLMTADLILARDATKLLFKANMIRKTRKKIKKNIRKEKFRTSFDRVLIENEAIRLWEDEIKKNDEAMQKKMIAEMKKSIAAEKKRIYSKEMIMRKRKRKKVKLVKEMKKTSKSKRSYRRRFQNSFISVFSTSQMKKTALEIEKSILQIEKSEVNNSASSMKDYTYQ